MSKTIGQKFLKPGKKRWLILIAVVFLILIISAPFIAIGVTGKLYQNKIYYNIWVNGLDLSGQSQKEASLILKKKADEIFKQGFEFTARDKIVTLQADLISTAGPDLTREIFSFNNEKTVASAYGATRGKNSWRNFNEKLTLLFSPKNLAAQFNFNDQEILTILKGNFSTLESPAQNADLVVTANSPLDFEIKPVKIGTIFDYDKALADFKNNLMSFKNNRLELATITDYPKVKEYEASQLIPQAKEIIKLAPLNLTYEKRKWEINEKTLADWLTARKEKNVFLDLNETKVTEFLEKIAQNIDVEAKEAKFKITGGKVSEFQESSPGKKLNREQSLAILRNKIIKEKQKEIPLVIETIEAKSDVGNINDLGISKLIGVGKSNFKGSPANRRHNIKVGSDTLNGLLIKPDEEFSLVGALGEIEASTGYLPELVIKGNKTTPEYGGGLCQIGTTMFRVVLNTGLPITERKNHSYRVVYYEPAGMDATIYNPKPDLRFINDTGHYILIQTKIESDDLIFEMWGTPDNRQIEVENPPRVFNITKPEPTKIIETEELPPGEKKCTEKSHNGADAAFTRKVTYSDGKIMEEVWRSHYRPWQAVCLVGKAKEEPKSPDNPRQPTLPNIESPTVTNTTP